MLERFISYFVKHHLVTNLLFVAILVGGAMVWPSLKKEELPDVTFDRILISVNYPGATAEEVEYFVTKEIEEQIKGLDGIYRISSTASQETTRITVELEKFYPNKDEAIAEIRNAVLDAKLPDEVLDDPKVRIFKTSKKAILDVAIIHTGAHLLDTPQRQLLQHYAHALENQLINLPQINSVNRKGYFQQELQIKVDPKKLIQFAIPIGQIRNEVSRNNVRQPAGHIETKNEPKVTINAQLATVEELNELYIQAGFEGQAIALKQIARVEPGFDLQKEIIKVNGHGAVMLNVVKNSGYGILESIKVVEETVERFRKTHLKDVAIDTVLLDDESIDVRNRLSIISINGIIGFTLIVITLLVFLNRRSGFWVAMGIPFTVSFTVIGASMLGYTINNITLAAVIIVMGVVVDDAIVVAENIGRLRAQGMNYIDAAVKGTSQVFMPVWAAIVTTCVAFLPLFFFGGRHSAFYGNIPPIIFLMLGASLLEALIILPGHMCLKLPIVNRFFKSKNNAGEPSTHWFENIEAAYGRLLIKILPFKYIAFGVFVLLMFLCVWLATQQMKFVMFPHEETRDIVISGSAFKTADRYETAEVTRKIEKIFEPYIGKEVVGYRTAIAKSRHGGAVHENRFRMIVEIVPKEEREKSANDLVSLWKPEIKNVAGLEKFIVQKSRWGQASGSPIEILVKENDDQLRESAANALAEVMKANPELSNIEIEAPINLTEYKVGLRRDKIKRLAINPADISATFRAALQGLVLYDIPDGDEEIDIRLSILDEAKTDIEAILDMPVENNQQYLVPLRDVVTITKTQTPESISRVDGSRVTTVYADFIPEAKLSPLEIAVEFERNIFPQVVATQPSTTLSFTGEIFDTRESRQNFKNAIILAVALIFIVLALLFDSLIRPLLIMIAIPFGVVGVVLAFWLHGKTLFGFYAAIGTLGMMGVVINDAIIMLSKLDREFAANGQNQANEKIARIAQTRLRAVILTTLTTVAGVLPTAYGIAGYDALLAEMMLALAWGLVFGTAITLLLIPCLYSFMQDCHSRFQRMSFG
ncbi:MAG: efflux RND transporter permease subunit [Gammaproteobacteria bacterium]|nr:efflux RND transporter permease subunit [Gammaproteobacteria bacterium]